MKSRYSNKTAECVGLWLAEGNNKCDNEITFTNNCPELITYFHRNLMKIFEGYTQKIRLYVYSKKPDSVSLPVKVLHVKDIWI